MCDSKAEGGRRCRLHTSEGRRTSRYAVKLYGANNPVTRAQVGALPPEFVGASFAQRAQIAETTGDPEVLRLALADTDAVKLGALSNPRVDPAILDAATTTSKQALVVIDNLSTRIDTLRRLVFEGKGTVQRAALTRLMRRNEDASEYVKSGSQQVREELATRTADPRIRAALLTDISPLVRERAVRNRHVAHGLPLTISDDPSSKVQLAAAKVTSNPVLLERLAHTNDLMVQDAILENPALTDDVVHTLALSGSETAREKLVRKGLAGRPTEKVISDRYASEFEIREAYKNADDAGRIALAGHYHAPDDKKIEHLRGQPEVNLLALAEGDDTSPRVLAKLALIQNQKLRIALIMNERTPAKIVRRFAGLKNVILSEAAREELARRK